MGAQVEAPARALPQAGHRTRSRVAGAAFACALCLLGSATDLAPTSTTVAAAAARNALAATTTSKPFTSSVLTIAEHLEPSVGDNFNPFDPSSTISQMGALGFIYEPLLQYNELQVDRYYPWLAGSWSFSLSGQTMTFYLRAAVTWEDGSPFTANDVAYTFNLLRDYPDINSARLPIVSAVATNPTTFTLTLSQPGWAYLYDIARVPIVKNGFAQGQDPASYVARAPDGTGPYKLARPQDLSPRRLVLTARTRYWQPGKPSVNTLVFPAYASAPQVQAALLKGSLDWVGPIPGVQPAVLARKDPDVHYWLPPISCVFLVVNLTHYPLNVPAVRRALSTAADRRALASASAGGYEPPATSSSGLVLPVDEQYLSADDSNDLPARADPVQARDIMLAAGFQMSRDGYWADASGDLVAFSIEQPAGSRYHRAASLLAQQLRAAGFDVSARAIAPRLWDADLASGRYDATILPAPTGPTPYYMYKDLLDPSLVQKGKADGGNYERLGPATDPAAAAAVTLALRQYRDSPSGSQAASSAIRALASVVSSRLPVVPLMYGVARGEFSTKHAVGWPGQDDPYEPPEPAAPFNEYTVLQLTATAG